MRTNHYIASKSWSEKKAPQQQQQHWVGGLFCWVDREETVCPCSSAYRAFGEAFGMSVRDELWPLSVIGPAVCVGSGTTCLNCAKTYWRLCIYLSRFEVPQPNATWRSCLLITVLANGVKVPKLELANNAIALRDFWFIDPTAETFTCYSSSMIQSSAKRKFNKKQCQIKWRCKI